MKTKTHNTANAVWAFVLTDANESDAKWAGCVSLFRRKADALRPIRAVPRTSREAFAKAIRKWKRVNKWRGAVRKDEIRVYGRAEDGRPVVDHIENVR